MPLLSPQYLAPFPLFSGHFQTIYSTLFRRVPIPQYSRERISTPDGDFLDLDWTRNGSKNIVVITHGLEGSSGSIYVKGLATYLSNNGYDVVVWNMRGCSGEPNLLTSFYHSGKSEDLRTVLEHIQNARPKDNLYLVGISVGGNITLKYLGEEGDALRSNIRSAVTWSVPVDLEDSAVRMGSIDDAIYMRWFLRLLKRKIDAKNAVRAGTINVEGYEKLRTFFDFDTRYTAPLNGFQSAHEYWAQASSKPWLSRIRIPTLLVNAQNDPFLGKGCFPIEVARDSETLFLESPKHGGHVGFVPADRSGPYWIEQRTLEFISNYR